MSLDLSFSNLFTLGLALLMAYLAFNSLMGWYNLRNGGRPFRVTPIDRMTAPVLPAIVQPIDDLLRANGYRLMGAQQIKQHWHSSPQVAYQYLSATGDTFAELAALGPSQSFFGLMTRFRDDSLIWMTFPMGEVINEAKVLAAYAAHNPQAALSHHHAAIETWTRQKGAPLVMRSNADVQATEDWYNRTHRARIYRRMRAVKLLMTPLYALAALFAGVEAARLIGGGETTAWSIAAMGGLIVPVIEMAFGGWLAKPPGPVDSAAVAQLPPAQQEEKKPVSLWRFAWFIPLLAIVALPVLFVANPGLLTQSFTEIRYQQDGEWVGIPSPGDQVRSLGAAPDGGLWGLTASTINRWDGFAWQVAYSTDNHAIEFAMDDDQVWTVTKEDIIRCDTTTQACEVAQAFDQGSAIAAEGGRVLALSQDATAAYYDGNAWKQFNLAERLPGFNAGDAPDYLATAAITSDGTEWIEWGQVWHRVRGRGEWQLALYEQEAPVYFDVIGTSPERVWTRWSNGLSKDEPDLYNWEFFYWEEIGGNYANKIFDLEADSRGDVWFATSDGLLYYTSGLWELIPVPEASVVTELAITPDDQLWVQITKGGSGGGISFPWIALLIIPVLLIEPTLKLIFRRLTGN
jgi:hypothetical protein